MHSTSGTEVENLRSIPSLRSFTPSLDSRPISTSAVLCNGACFLKNQTLQNISSKSIIQQHIFIPSQLLHILQLPPIIVKKRPFLEALGVQYHHPLKSSTANMRFSGATLTLSLGAVAAAADIPTFTSTVYDTMSVVSSVVASNIAYISSSAMDNLKVGQHIQFHPIFQKKFLTNIGVPVSIGFLEFSFILRKRSTVNFCFLVI